LDVVVLIVATVWISLASEVAEDFLELVALLLELGLEFADEGIETSLVGILALLELDGGQGRGYVRGGRFDDIVILDSRRLGSLTRRLMTIGRAFGHRELVRGFLLPRVLLVRGCHRYRTDNGGQMSRKMGKMCEECGKHRDRRVK